MLLGGINFLEKIESVEQFSKAQSMIKIIIGDEQCHKAITDAILFLLILLMRKELIKMVILMIKLN